MWRRSLTLYVALLLSRPAAGDSVVKASGRLGQRVTLPCAYHYDDPSPVSRLSAQWRSPRRQLLCHYIKHKAFQNCTAGYSMSDRPGAIALTIQRVKMDDFGAHVCSVSRRHQFSDVSIELARIADSVTSAPTSGGSHPGGFTDTGFIRGIIILHTVTLFVCI